ncbi:MAG: TetR/AcrR family transcriptional regulator, partial [Actinomycetota bacterium]|nr:TetR/AcrR family transcriptional regulator [Actinomycetota bacterium]
RERIVGTSSELFRRQGYNATGIKQIVTAAQAPLGSLYHFFPGGKEELGAETIRWSGALYLQLIDAFFDPSDIVGSVERFFAGAAETVRETDYADACPIATVAGEVASTSEPLRQASADVFESWIARTAGYMAEAGIPETRARELAISTLAILEGAFLLSRAGRDTAPMAIAGATAAAAVRVALPGA